MINAFILCDLFENFRNIMQQTEKKALTGAYLTLYTKMSRQLLYKTFIFRTSAGGIVYDGHWDDLCVQMPWLAHTYDRWRVSRQYVVSCADLESYFEQMCDGIHDTCRVSLLCELSCELLIQLETCRGADKCHMSTLQRYIIIIRCK